MDKKRRRTKIYIGIGNIQVEEKRTERSKMI
jgi:hypothetical protein